MKRQFGISSVMALAITCIVGCASPGDVRQGVPSAEFQSGKSSKQVALCVSDGLQSTAWERLLRVRPTQTGYTLLVTDDDTGMTHFVVDVYDKADNLSQTKYWENNPLVKRETGLMIKQCQ